MRYSFGLYSLEPDVLEDPVVSVSSTGIIPDRPFSEHTHACCELMYTFPPPLPNRVPHVLDLQAVQEVGRCRQGADQRHLRGGGSVLQRCLLLWKDVWR